MRLSNWYFICLHVVLITLCVITVGNALAEEPADSSPGLEEGNLAEVVWEFDPYYTDVGWYKPLTNEPIPTITSDSEIEILGKLVQGSAIPRYMLLEASVYPMPVMGTYLKRNETDFYNNGRIGNSGVNFFQSATAGFQEPWAVSAFFGNIATLVRPGETRKGNNFGYTGYLVSAGSKHIKDNEFIDDNWYELEWKIKGKRNFPKDKMQWSFRVGGKFHDNPDITNVVYVAINRSNLNSRFPFLSWINNAVVDLKVHYSQLNGQLIRAEAIVGKKYPLEDKSYTPNLRLGIVWSSPNEYTGILFSPNKSQLTLVIRPSIEF